LAEDPRAMKHCETFEHTADIGLSAWGDSLGELLEALAEGLAGLMCAPEGIHPSERRALSVTGSDVETLTVDFLAGALTLMTAERFCVREVRVTAADSDGAEAELVGEPLDPGRHEMKVEVKAVTYHDLSVRRQDGRWTARVLLDV